MNVLLLWDEGEGIDTFLIPCNKKEALMFKSINGCFINGEEGDNDQGANLNTIYSAISGIKMTSDNPEDAEWCKYVSRWTGRWKDRRVKLPIYGETLKSIGLIVYSGFLP
jgi:hypothetical protein